jgi:thiamine kinase-like enzyme
METPLDEVLACAFPGGVLRVEPLPGGLTNANHRVWTGDGCFVLRRWRDDGGLLAIDRGAEHANSVRAARAGVGAAVVAHLPECNAMVFAHVDGQTLCAEDLRRGDRLEHVATACRRLHAAERFDGDFDMFEVAARYREVVRRHGFRLPERHDEFAARLEVVREALAVRAGPTVPCNNDLLAENFIARGDELTIIDYEYGGNNDPCFELGNICSESGLSLAQLAQLVTAYHGRPLRHQVARARLYGLVAKHGWTLWASIQDGSSPLDFEFWAWGMEKHERAVAEWDDPAFEQLLAEAQRPD